MMAFVAWVIEHKGSYVGGRGHTRCVAIQVKGDNKDEEQNDEPKDWPKDKEKGNGKAK